MKALDFYNLRLKFTGKVQILLFLNWVYRNMDLNPVDILMKKTCK